MNTSGLRGYDLVLLLLVLGMVAVGIAMIYSVTGVYVPPGSSEWDLPLVRQALYAGAGLFLMAVLTAIDYRFWKRSTWPLYGVMLLLLGALFVVGQVSFGARSWLNLVLFPIQPSELSKVILVLVLAKYLSDKAGDAGSFQHVLVTLVIAVAPAALVYLQPDMGTAMILAVIWLGMVFAGGTRVVNLVILGMAGSVVTPVIWFSIQPYMRDRIVAFFNPAGDPTGASYNTIQAMISIGSGGLWGKGFQHGTQSQLEFLRVRHTDYVFSALAEETGFIGSVALMVVLTLLLMRILSVAQRARDPYGRLIACGVFSMILVQSVVNLGMNVNLLPVTGLPLPLVSYGGSSLISTLMSLGLVESVAIRSQEPGYGS